MNKFQNNLTDTEAKFNLIEALQKKLTDKFGLMPIIGLELEFYLNNGVDIEEIGAAINKPVKTERGKNQYEIDINPTSDIKKLVEEYHETKSKIIKFATNKNYQANFDPKPSPTDYGSSLHIHLNFANLSADKEKITIEKCANILCNFIEETKDFFLSAPTDYSRLDRNFMAPTHICWGGNNRTCMIRIPDAKPYRLEHRLASSNIDPILPIYAILASILAGLENPEMIKEFPKIFGNAYDKQYNLLRI